MVRLKVLPSNTIKTALMTYLEFGRYSIYLSKVYYLQFVYYLMNSHWVCNKLLRNWWNNIRIWETPSMQFELYSMVLIIRLIYVLIHIFIITLHKKQICDCLDLKFYLLRIILTVSCYVTDVTTLRCFYNIHFCDIKASCYNLLRNKPFY